MNPGNKQPQSEKLQRPDISKEVVNLQRRITELEELQAGHKQIETELQRSEEKYRSLFELAQDSILLTDTNGVVISFNPAGLKQTGYTEEEIVGKHFTDIPLFRPQDIPRFTAIFKSIMNGEQVETFEMVFKHKNGELHFGEARLSVLKVADKVCGAQAITRDITQRKQNDEALRQSEVKYATLVEKANDGIVILQDGVVKFANSRIAHFVDYSPDEAMGQQMTRFISPQYHAIVLERYERRMRGEIIPENYEINLVAKDGRTVPVEINGSLLEYQGRPADMLIIRDISERRQIEQSLMESEEKYRNLVERANDGILIVQDGIIRFMNQCLGTMCGHTVDQTIGTAFTDYIHPKELQSVIERYRRRVLGEDVPPIYESVVKHKNGSDIYVEFNAANISYRGRIADLVLVRDITERKKAEEDHTRSLEKLHKAMESTVQALAMTLEIRDPYTAGHQQRVTQLACAIGRETGLSQSQIDGIGISGAVHDIGKIYVPAELLSKPGRLNEIEFSMIKMHPKAGYDILKGIEFPWPVATIVHQHHERMDGSGYPQGLSGEAILLESRILAIADVIEAISSHRPYRPALGIGAALDEISKNRNTFYDPAVVDASLKLFTEKDFKFE